MEIKMEDKEVCNTAKELSREQLIEILNQVSQQDKNLVKENNRLKEVLTEMNLTNLFKRLDYLFKVIDSDTPLFSTDFKAKCAKNIEDIMFQEETEESMEPEE